MQKRLAEILISNNHKHVDRKRALRRWNTLLLAIKLALNVDSDVWKMLLKA
jgi:hypothetical protein